MKAAAISLRGRPFDALALPERKLLTGKWVAFEIYSPETLPLRIIEAVGDSARECAQQLRERGLKVSNFEFSLLPPPF